MKLSDGPIPFEILIIFYNLNCESKFMSLFLKYFFQLFAISKFKLLVFCFKCFLFFNFLGLILLEE